MNKLLLNFMNQCFIKSSLEQADIFNKVEKFYSYGFNINECEIIISKSKKLAIKSPHSFYDILINESEKYYNKKKVKK